MRIVPQAIQLVAAVKRSETEEQRPGNPSVTLRSTEATTIAVTKKPALTPAPTTVAATGNWLVQVGVFANPGNVKKLQKDLETRGYTVYTRTSTTSSGKTLARVLVGPGAQRSAAAATQLKLASEVQLKGTLVAMSHV